MNSLKFLTGSVGVDHQHVGRAADHADGREVLDRVVGQLARGRAGAVRGDIALHQRVAVGRRRAVVCEAITPPPPPWLSTTKVWFSSLAPAFGDGAPDHVAAAAGGHRHDVADGLVRIALRPRQAGLLPRARRRMRAACSSSRLFTFCLPVEVLAVCSRMKASLTWRAMRSSQRAASPLRRAARGRSRGARRWRRACRRRATGSSGATDAASARCRDRSRPAPVAGRFDDGPVKAQVLARSSAARRAPAAAASMASMEASSYIGQSRALCLRQDAPRGGRQSRRAGRASRRGRAPRRRRARARTRLRACAPPPGPSFPARARPRARAPARPEPGGDVRLVDALAGQQSRRRGSWPSTSSRTSLDSEVSRRSVRRWGTGSVCQGSMGGAVGRRKIEYRIRNGQSQTRESPACETWRFVGNSRILAVVRHPRTLKTCASSSPKTSANWPTGWCAPSRKATSRSTGSTTARLVRRSLKATRYDALILDLGLPGLGGHDVLADLRAADQRLPMLILTARDSLIERVEQPARGRRRLPGQALRAGRARGTPGRADPPRTRQRPAALRLRPARLRRRHQAVHPGARAADADAARACRAARADPAQRRAAVEAGDPRPRVLRRAGRAARRRRGAGAPAAQAPAGERGRHQDLARPGLRARKRALERRRLAPLQPAAHAAERAAARSCCWWWLPSCGSRGEPRWTRPMPPTTARCWAQ